MVAYNGDYKGTITKKTKKKILKQILPSRLLMNNIEQRLRTEPARPRRTHRLISKSCIGVVDLDRRAAAPGRRRISQQLRVAALLEADEPEHRLLDGGTHR